MPGLSGWRNCRWLPRVRVWTQPSRSTSRIASRTVGKTRSVRPSKTAAQRQRAQPRTTSDRGPANLTVGVRRSSLVLDSVLRLHTYVDRTHIGRINIEHHGDRLASSRRHLVEVSRLGENTPKRGNRYRPPLAGLHDFDAMPQGGRVRLHGSTILPASAGLPRTPPRWTPTGNGLQRGQSCWPPLGRTVGRQRATCAR